VAVVVLVVLGGLVVVAANVATWVRGAVLDRDTFVDALRPLADDEDLREALELELTDRVLAFRPEAAPDRGDGDDEELAAAIEGALDVVLTGPLFETMWTDAARLAHDQVERLVHDGGRRVELDLGELLTRVDQLLEEQGHDLLDEERIERIDDIVVERDDQVAQVVDAVQLVERLAVVLPFVALGLFAGVVALTRRRALGVAATGAAVAVAALVTLAVAFVARSWVVGRVDAGPRRAAAGDVWDGLLGPLRDQTLLLLGVGLAVAVGAGVISRVAGDDPVDGPSVVEDHVRW
jgi:hypothetical protein